MRDAIVSLRFLLLLLTRLNVRRHLWLFASCVTVLFGFEDTSSFVLSKGVLRWFFWGGHFGSTGDVKFSTTLLTMARFCDLNKWKMKKKNCIEKKHVTSKCVHPYTVILSFRYSNIIFHFWRLIHLNPKRWTSGWVIAKMYSSLVSIFSLLVWMYDLGLCCAKRWNPSLSSAFFSFFFCYKIDW